MNDFINRESFRADVLQMYCKDCAMRKNVNGKTVYALGGAPCRACEIEDLIDYIEDYTAADVRENVRGKWEDYDDTERFSARCSICGGIAETRFGMNFCGYCGAEMREVKIDE